MSGPRIKHAWLSHDHYLPLFWFEHYYSIVSSIFTTAAAKVVTWLLSKFYNQVAWGSSYKNSSVSSRESLSSYLLWSQCQIRQGLFPPSSLLRCFRIVQRRAVCISIVDYYSFTYLVICPRFIDDTICYIISTRLSSFKNDYTNFRKAALLVYLL